MPGFDGTGPQGEGPLSGRGEGYCAVKLPAAGELPSGYSGLQGWPVRLGTPLAAVQLRGLRARRVRAVLWPRRAFAQRRGPGAGRGRGRRGRR